MALDFPNSPTIGQQYDAWVWNGTTWDFSPAGAGETELSGYDTVNISGFSATVSTTRVLVGALSIAATLFPRIIHGSTAMLLNKTSTYVDLYFSLETTAPGGSPVVQRIWRNRLLASGESVELAIVGSIPTGHSARLITEVAANASNAVTSAGAGDMNRIGVTWTAQTPAAGLRTEAVETGDYVPNLVNFSVGTTGTPINDARYTFVGGPNPGDEGLLSVYGRWQLGTNFTITATPAVQLPSGFTTKVVGSSSNYYTSSTLMSPTGSGGNFFGMLRYSGSQLLTFMTQNVAGTYNVSAAVSSSVPAAWTAAGFCYYQATLPAVRV